MFTLPIEDILSLGGWAGKKYQVMTQNYADLIWSDASPKPTEPELLAAENRVAQAMRIAHIKREVQERIEAVYPLWPDLIYAALGLYDENKTKAIKDHAAKVKADSEQAIAAVNALQTVEEVRDFAW